MNENYVIYVDDKHVAIMVMMIILMMIMRITMISMPMHVMHGSALVYIYIYIINFGTKGWCRLVGGKKNTSFRKQLDNT